ncbi:LRR receptor serine/threonine-protein kinase [Spatholobus suberectus]|nr:LRR receptor serine/threonine-protein kinase [Spatholobus suberectus]
MITASGKEWDVMASPDTLSSLFSIGKKHAIADTYSFALARHKMLMVLDVSGNPLVVDEVAWLSKLSSLKHLAMNGVDLGEAYNLLQVLDMLPFLLQVEFSRCDLTNMHFPAGHVNSTFLANVQVLNLSQNLLSGPIPDAFMNLSSIRDLNLGYNNLTSLPYWLVNLDSLVNLNLSGNPFKRVETSVLSILTNMCSLRSLDLSSSMPIFGGSGLGHGNYSGCGRYDLDVLMLRGNGIKDSLPRWFGQLLNLKMLDLAVNSFYGFWAFFGTLLLKRDWRHAYFRYVDGVVDKMYVAIMVRVTRQKM